MWWLKARRPMPVALTVGVLLAAGLLVGELTLPVPNQLIRIETPPLLIFVLPIGIALAVAAVLPSQDDAGVERVATRNVPLLDSAFTVAVTVATIVLATMLHLLLDWQLWEWFARNTVGYLGVVLIARVVLSGRAAGVAAAIAMVVVPSAFGTRWDGSVRPWAWPIAREATAVMYAQIAIAFVVGVGLLALSVREGAVLRALQRPLGLRSAHRATNSPESPSAADHSAAHPAAVDRPG